MPMSQICYVLAAIHVSYLITISQDVHIISVHSVCTQFLYTVFVHSLSVWIGLQRVQLSRRSRTM